MDKRKIFDKFILLFLMFSPILDLIAYFQDKYINIPISISYIIRGLFLLVILIYLLRKRNDRKLLFIFLIYFILALSSYFMRKLNIYTELVNAKTPYDKLSLLMKEAEEACLLLYSEQKKILLQQYYTNE